MQRSAQESGSNIVRSVAILAPKPRRVVPVRNIFGNFSSENDQIVCPAKIFNAEEKHRGVAQSILTATLQSAAIQKKNQLSPSHCSLVDAIPADFSSPSIINDFPFSDLSHCGNGFCAFTDVRTSQVSCSI